MIIIGLTGSIAMGKSRVASFFKRLRVPVFDADKAVHELYHGDPEAMVAIKKHFPGAIKHGKVDRPALSALVVGKPEKFKLLESIIHPLVRKKEERFLTRARRRGYKAVVLEIPLLFETKAEQRCDVVVAVVAPRFLQRQRALRRKNMTREKLEQIRKKQMSDAEKIKRADYVIRSGMHKGQTLRAVKALLRALIS